MNNSNYLYRSVTHFEGLNTLRFFAALLVVISHAEGMKLKRGLEQIAPSLSFTHNGYLAVAFFFVLSGFLITFLLLKEKKKTHTVDVKNFYLKRVLRIWPLYYLLVIIGCFILPLAMKFAHVDYEMPYTFGEVWYYFVFFMPGLVTFYYGNHLLEPLWSIGVEEVFYLIWAPLFKFIKHNILYLLLGVIILHMICSIIPYLIETSVLYSFIVNTLRFDAMAIGGLGAYYIFNTKKDISNNILYKIPLQIIIYTFFLAFIIFNSNINLPIWRFIFDTPIVSTLVINFLFIYLIIGVSLAKNNIFKLRNKTLSYFGEISYGVYMYHNVVLAVVMLVIIKLPFKLPFWLENICFYGLSLGGILLVSHLSKKYFENFFLKFRKK